MKNIWTVAFRETVGSDMYSDNIGLFSSEEKAIAFAKKRADDFYENKQSYGNGNWSKPTRSTREYNGTKRTRFTLRSGFNKVEFDASLQEYFSDEDAE